MSNLKIAAAVAGLLAAGAAPTAFAYVGVTQAQAANGVPFYIVGSSAAVSGFGSSVGADICQANTLTTFTTNPAAQPVSAVTTTLPKTPDFRAFSCIAAKPAAYAGQVITIYYRAEGGSVVGVYGPYNNLTVNQLNLGAAQCAADTHSGTAGAATANQFDCATSNNPVFAAPLAASVNGTSPVQGPTDGYTGAVVPELVQYGISDVEPGALGNGGGELFAGNGNNDPAGGTYPFLGADATPDQLQAMPHSLIFQQTFGFVANASLGISNLTTGAVASILAGTVTDWNKVVNPATGTPATAVSTPIVVCHRDLGSGTRTAADIVFEKDGCDPGAATVPLNDLNSANDSFSTGDVLACVQNSGNAGGQFGYVAIDNYSKAGSAPYANVTALNLDGRTPSSKLTAEGGWEYAVEASMQKATNFTPSTNQKAMFDLIVADMKALATAPQSAQINVLPGIGGNAKNNGTLQTNSKINVTSYYRDNSSGNSCNPMLQQ
jgi:hypothetical protein